MRALNAIALIIAVLGGIVAAPDLARASTAPDWMHALVNAPVPAHDDKATAVMLYSETVLRVQDNGKIKRMERKAFRILRPEGEIWGRVTVDFDGQSRITSLDGWCIPATGKDYHVDESDAIETALPGIRNGELLSDLKAKVLQIPAATPGNIVGYEYEQEQKPYFMDDDWDFQDTIPVAEARYTLQLPTGWSYKSLWINHPEVNPVAGSGSAVQWRWTVTNAPAVPIERQMPPWRGVASRMVVALIPPAGQQQALLTWKTLGNWYANLANGRLDASPEIKRKVAELTAGESTPLGKMRVLAKFVQDDIRYVAIELGIGGHQPHPATDVFAHRYGDCKDKAGLLSSMLAEIGIRSHYLLINTVRGTVTDTTPPNLGFNHAILAIQLPAALTDPSIRATITNTSLGRVLFFDPTDNLTPFGSLSGALQGNYGLLVAPDGGELVALPQLPTDTNSLRRTAKLSVDDGGQLSGEFVEVLQGDLAAEQRGGLRSAVSETDRIKRVESLAAESLSSFEIVKAGVVNLSVTDKPFEWHYTLEAAHYAKISSDLMMVRPRILDEWSSNLLETREPRTHPIEFDGPEFRTEVIEIALPPGYAIDELPPPVNLDFAFAAYHSKTEALAHAMRYTRTLEIKQLSVPAANSSELKSFYRTIFADERHAAVLKKATP